MLPPSSWKECLTILRLTARCVRFARPASKATSLEGLIFVADDFAECEKPVKVKENGEEKEVMQRGKWRLQKSAHLNGLAVLDVDHLKDDPRKLFEKWTIEQLRELGVLLVFITSSNEGIKFVFMARKEWGNLIQNACELARQLGLEADKSGKDASRMSYAPSRQAGDILFYDAERMFSYENPEYDELFGEQYRQGNSDGASLEVKHAGVKEVVVSDLLYKGVPMQKIVDCWVGQDLPESGERHKTSLELASDLDGEVGPCLQGREAYPQAYVSCFEEGGYR